MTWTGFHGGLLSAHGFSFTAFLFNESAVFMERRYIFPKAMHAVLLLMIFNHSLQTAPLLTEKGPLTLVFISYWKLMHWNWIIINLFSFKILIRDYWNWHLEWVKVAEMCSTLWDPMYYTVHGTLQARVL